MEPRVHVITLAVDDLQRALTFYRDGLGLPTRGVVLRSLGRHASEKNADYRPGCTPGGDCTGRRNREYRVPDGDSTPAQLALAYHGGMGALAVLMSSACISASVSYAAPPDPRAPRIPWIHAGPVSGYLFYYGATGPWKTLPGRVFITPHGGPPGGYATKILWHVRGGSATVTVVGQRLDAPGRFRQRFPGIGGGYFPSILSVPTVGCWRIAVHSGRRVGRFAFLGVDA